MVLVDGLRFGIETASAFFQSTKSLESCFSQKARSSASVLKFGIFLALLINSSLFSVHVASRNNANQRILRAQGKGNMQESGTISFAQPMVAGFRLAVLAILQHQERLIEKHLLGLESANLMFFKAFPVVSSVPVEAGYLRPINHGRILPAYTLKARLKSASKTRQFARPCGPDARKLAPLRFALRVRSSNERLSSI